MPYFIGNGQNYSVKLSLESGRQATRECSTVKKNLYYLHLFYTSQHFLLIWQVLRVILPKTAETSPCRA
jgi:hypothetical protein